MSDDGERATEVKEMDAPTDREAPTRSCRKKLLAKTHWGLARPPLCHGGGGAQTGLQLFPIQAGAHQPILSNSPFPRLPLPLHNTLSPSHSSHRLRLQCTEASDGL